MFTVRPASRLNHPRTSSARYPHGFVKIAVGSLLGRAHRNLQPSRIERGEKETGLFKTISDRVRARLAVEAGTFGRADLTDLYLAVRVSTVGDYATSTLWIIVWRWRHL